VGKKKTLDNPKIWHAPPAEQGGRHGPGEINSEENQKNLAVKTRSRLIKASICWGL